MAVDSLRETRHINRIRPADLSALWTAQSYRPDITSALADVRQMPTWLPLGKMCRDPIAQGRTPAYASDGTGYPCLKTKHINGLIVDDSDPDWVTTECASTLARFKVAQSTVLMNRSGAGSIGRCSVYLGTSAPLTNEHVLHIRIAAPHDPCFVAAYLSSWWGERAIEQGVTGSTGQLNLANEHVSRVPAPAPSPDAQRYIGDKVRQAERLRERARSLESNVGQLHARYIVPPTGIDFGKRTRRLASRSLTERLDAHFYPSAVEQYFKQSGLGARSLDRLTTVVVNGQSQPEHEGGVPQATVTNLGRSFVEGSLRTVKRPSDVDRALRPHDLLLCNAAHNKTYIGRDVTYSQVEGVYPSTEVMVIRVDRSQLPASYVRQYLKTEIGYLQIQSTIRGITAHSYPGDVKQIEVPVPTVPADEQPAWFATDDMMLAAGRCADAAKVLTGMATLLVQRLIEGKVTEADLVAAQKALEAGDRGPDRAILSALRPNDSGQPLIPDLDGLYALLGEFDEDANA